MKSIAEFFAPTVNAPNSTKSPLKTLETAPSKSLVWLLFNANKHVKHAIAIDCANNVSRIRLRNADPDTFLELDGARIPVMRWSLFQKLVDIEIIGAGLVGSLPSCLCSLTNLTRLILKNNNLNGSITSEIGSLSSLQVLDLCENSLIGEIPHSIGKLNRLQILNLHSNQLSGPIPSQLTKLTSLSFLSLAVNKLCGEIQFDWSVFQNLATLDLGMNFFRGGIPISLGTASSLLEVLKLSGNLFSGSIPRQLALLKKLSVLTLDANQLVGTVPPELSKLSCLVKLSLAGNKFDGPLHRDILAITRRKNNGKMEKKCVCDFDEGVLEKDEPGGVRFLY
ncbi:hypothetical protein HDU79_000216 [Rhizoclosmatium sp. JEL0117]|nr:hypothetical protein HDU79_000216 [Rhizoclosmatium sp. JEL0117]